MLSEALFTRGRGSEDGGLVFLTLEILGRREAKGLLEGSCEVGRVFVCTECSNFGNVQFRMSVQQVAGSSHTDGSDEV